MIKVIRTRAEYDAALATVEELLDRDPASNTADADRLELLTVLVQDYEARAVPAALPTPIDAIRFRMEEGGLTQKDLVPYIGSKSKVSEVLSGKRALTLTMIRALHAGLGIPAKVLLQDQSEAELDPLGIEWDRFPVAEMVKRGWITGTRGVAEARDHAESLLKRFFHPVGSPAVVAALYKQTRLVRTGRPMDKYALAAWTARIMLRAKAHPPPVDFVPGTVTPDFMREVARLSWPAEGPRLAREFLEAHGIGVVVEPHLPRTHLDGAAVLLDTGRPVIGMTLRHDRLDNYWFCLLHELAHVGLHLAWRSAAVPSGERSSTPADSSVDEPTQFFDDLDVGAGGNLREEEADGAAGEALIPDAEWRASPASMLRTASAARALASKLRVHPAVVAGHIRYVHNDYRVLGDLVGQGEVRKLFPDVSWD